MTESPDARARRRRDELAAMRPGGDVFCVQVEARIVGAPLLSDLDDVARDHPGNHRMQVLALRQGGNRVVQLGRRVDKWDPDLMQDVLACVAKHRVSPDE
jgi:hypothetical protein